MELTVIGGGLAGSESAWQAAEAGVDVLLYEMRPLCKSGVHHTDLLGELVCFNYFGLKDMAKEEKEGFFAYPRCHALLREELSVMGSLLVKCASNSQLPSDKYFALDRNKFAGEVTERLYSHRRIKIIRKEVAELPDTPAVIATGPLTSQSMAQAITSLTGKENYFPFEASAPVIHGQSINYDSVIEGSDCIYCPLNGEEFDRFFTELVNADRVKPHTVEQVYMTDMKIPDTERFDSLGGQAIETHNRESLLKHVMSHELPGQSKPVVKLLKEPGQNLYKITGFQTKLKHGEQKRVFRMIPGLEKGEFVRFGHIHLSCYINSGQCYATLQHRKKENLFFAGEVAGTDSYLAAIGTGWLAGRNGARLIKGEKLLHLPLSTMYGALCHHLASTPPHMFQPVIPSIFLLDNPPSYLDLKDMEKIKNFYNRSLADLKRLVG
ncbi:MAG: methylenetetrahydrofolate--tRNA-(uracil(54)-C(5))-methyltransferase (FADH(2)-oxidizing) TrmFO [Candidatus Eremiobacterota bacterium]